jgi:hypothetical protein
MAMFDFIEGWYNPHRRHSARDSLSSIAYERAYVAQPGSRVSRPTGKRHRASAAGSGKIGEEEPEAINPSCGGQSTNQLQSPTPSSTETG